MKTTCLINRNGYDLFDRQVSRATADEAKKSGPKQPSAPR